MGAREREAAGLSRTPLARAGRGAFAGVSIVLAACSRSPRAHATASAAPSAIRFVEDDYAGALVRARARGVPLFIDAWASWCHTCLSMRAFVFGDPALSAVSDRYEWLAIDTERVESAPLVERLGVKVLPTLYVVDSRDERVLLAWPGSLTAPELVQLLDDARTGGEPRGPLAVDAAVARESRDERFAECAETAARASPTMPPGTALADVVRAGIDCAERLPAPSPGRARLGDLAALGERVASDGAQPILADDRSDLYDYVLGAYRELARDGDAARVARAWSAFLDGEAARAPTPTARAVFDAHRLLAYQALGQPERAVPMLEQSRRDFPDDYNPPARLASAYLSMKRYDDALAAAAAALSLARGPRRLRIASLEADILVAKGDVAGARAALRDALAFARTIPLAESYPKQVDAMARRLAELGTSP